MDGWRIKEIGPLKKREWCKRGKSEKYLKLKSEFDNKYKKAAEKYLEKMLES